MCERETHFRRHECTQSTLLSDSNQVVQAECHLVASCDVPPLKKLFRRFRSGSRNRGRAPVGPAPRSRVRPIRHTRLILDQLISNPDSPWRGASRQYRSGNRNCALNTGIRVVPTLRYALAPRYIDTRKFVGPSLAATQEGSSETRKLGIWNQGVPWARTQEGSSETRKLGIWKLGVPWARTQEGPSETRKLGIWNLGILWAWTQEGPSETRKLGIWNLVGPPDRTERGPWKVGNSESGIC